MTAERLQKVLAASGVASRRAAEALITAGRVTVDGRPATLGERVDPAAVRILVDGRPIAAPTAPVHLALHKPPGFTSTVRDPHAARTVLDLVPAGLRSAGTRIYPVGRLDRESEGLLLLTNDGPWADRVLHPRRGVHREYAVAVEEPLARATLDTLRTGVDLDDGPARVVSLRASTAAEDAALAALIDPQPSPGLVWYRVVLGEGRKRQVRRMLAAVGAPVRRLVRVRIGAVRLDGLSSGAVRALSEIEVRALGTDRA